jgi:hypothetical protein
VTKETEKPLKNRNILNIPTKSPTRFEITWGQCPRVPKENGGLLSKVKAIKALLFERFCYKNPHVI